MEKSITNAVDAGQPVAEQANLRDNMHVKIIRPDMIGKLNAVLAKHLPDALPAPR